MYPPPLPPQSAQHGRTTAAQAPGPKPSTSHAVTRVSQRDGGNLYANSLTYALLASFYYCPMSSGVLSELLSPSISRGGSLVAAVAVPRRLHNARYAVLVEELRAKHDAVALGLHRVGILTRDGPGGPAHYTLVNPPPGMPLYSGSIGCDTVFVLAHTHVELAQK